MKDHDCGVWSWALLLISSITEFISLPDTLEHAVYSATSWVYSSFYVACIESGIWQRITLEPDSRSLFYFVVITTDILKKCLKICKYLIKLNKINFNTDRKLFALAMEWKYNKVITITEFLFKMLEGKKSYTSFLIINNMMFSNIKLTYSKYVNSRLFS